MHALQVFAPPLCRGQHQLSASHNGTYDAYSIQSVFKLSTHNVETPF